MIDMDTKLLNFVELRVLLWRMLATNRIILQESAPTGISVGDV